MFNFKKAAAVIAAAALTTIGALVTPTMAAPSTLTGGDISTATWSGDGSYRWGNYRFDGVETAFYCADEELRGPRHGGTYTPLSTDTWVNHSGKQIADSTLWQLGYIIDHHGQTTDPLTASSVALATWTLLESVYDVDGAGTKPWADGLDSRIIPTARSFIAEAQQLAGPYTMTLDATPSHTPVRDGDTLTVTTRVLSAAGVAMPNLSISLNGQTISTGTSGTATSSFTLRSGDTFRASATVTGMAGKPIAYRPSNPIAQRVMTGSTVSLSASDPMAYTAPFEPTITTTSSADGDQLRVGDTVTDTITVSGGRPGASMDILTRLYGPVATEPEQSPNAPAGTPLVQEATMTVKLDAQGNATVTTAPYTAKASGWYSYDTDFAGDDNHTAFDAGYGVPSETGHVNPWTPEATTRTSDQLVTGPDALADTVVVSGGKPGSEFTGSATLHGPFNTDPTGSDLADAPTVGTVTFAGNYDAGGNAEVTTPPVEVSKPGFYVWAETIDAVPGVAEQWKQTTAIASETSVNIQPTIHTMVNDQMVLPGHTISDRVQVTGIVNSVGGKPVTNVITGTLYGPVAPVDGSCKLVDWTDAPVALELDAVEVEADADGNAEFDGYGEHVVVEPGCYTYAETLTSSVEGDDTPVVVEHERGQDAQTAVALPPTVETEISAPMVKAGEPVTDTIHVRGTGGTPWTVTATLWQMQASSCTALTHDDWTKAVEAGEAKSISEQTVKGRGDDTVTTKPVTVEQTGCVTWQTTADFEGSTVVVESEFGIPSESGTVLLPRVETVAKTSSSHAGADIYDTIRVTGMYGHDGVLTGHVLGPVKSADGNCEAVDWTGAPKLGDIETVQIDGDGEYTSSRIKTTTAGCYTFVETLTVGDIEVSMEAGIPSETVYLVPVPEPERGVNTEDVGSGSDVTGDGSGGDETEGGGIEAGEPMTGGWNPALVAAGLVMLAGAGGIGYRFLAHRTN